MSQTLSYAVDDPTRVASRFSHVVPLAFVTYSLAFLDRVNYGYAEAAGMAHTLGIGPKTAAMLPALFFPGYCLLQIPAANWASRRNVKWLVFYALLLWGLLSGLTGILTNVKLLMADRLVLGAVEGVVLPAMLVYLTRWFTKPQRSRANALLILANPVTMMFASLVSGLLITHFNVHKFAGFEGWQMMFLAEGVPSIIWAFLWLFLADERPGEARWLAPAESQAVQQQLDDEQRELKHVPNYWAAFADRRVVIWSLMYLCFSAAAYGFMFWLPTILKARAAPNSRAWIIYATIPYFLGMFSMMLVSWASDRSLQRRPYVAGSMFVGCAAFCVSFLAGPQHFWIAFAGLIVVGSCIYTPCGPIWAWMSDLLPRNVVGESMALVNTAGAVGGFLGSYFVGVLTSPGHPAPGFAVMAACFAAAGVLAMIVRPANTGKA
ncbi:MAG TPA: MFS transporter [Tepidisphaeraceae bacterium]|nr:MFS transporter [Tepidisphaeraceae bacterium]